MENLDSLLKDLTAKDEAKAQLAAKYMIDNADIELFKKLVDKTEFLFDFVRNNVCNRIEKAIDKDNFKNILKFFDVYSVYYDELFTSILAQNANQNLTDEIFDLLLKGTNSQKAYSAKYFYFIPDTIALEALCKNAFSDDEFLAYNCAEALSQMRDDISYDIALNNLDSDDDFEKLKAVKFFVAYGRDFPFEDIFQSIRNSKMPENMAGQIPYMASLCELINSKEKENALYVFECIINGLGEILPLADIFQFETYEILQFLINTNNVANEFSSQVAEILLKAYSKFSMFEENQEYTFDETKEVKQEIASIYNILKSQSEEFWKNQKSFVLGQLKGDSSQILELLPLIIEYNLLDAIPSLLELVNNTDERVVCEVLCTLKNFNALADIDLDSIIAKIENPNIKAVISNLKSI